jgi:hypothetical protein
LFPPEDGITAPFLLQDTKIPKRNCKADITKFMVVPILQKIGSCQFSEIYGTIEKSLERYSAGEEL